MRARGRRRSRCGDRLDVGHDVAAVAGRPRRGAAEPAAPVPDDPEEKRLANNNVAYTKAQFLAFYHTAEEAEAEWEAARSVQGTGATNALTGRVSPKAESIVQEMYSWYQERVDDTELNVVFDQLQKQIGE